MKNRLINFLSRKQGAILMLALGLVVLLFIAILLATYIVAKKANPIILDESGKPVAASSYHTPTA
jgi:hypothetical protein